MKTVRNILGTIVLLALTMRGDALHAQVTYVFGNAYCEISEFGCSGSYTQWTTCTIDALARPEWDPYRYLSCYNTEEIEEMARTTCSIFDSVSGSYYDHRAFRRPLGRLRVHGKFLSPAIRNTGYPIPRHIRADPCRSL